MYHTARFTLLIGGDRRSLRRYDLTMTVDYGGGTAIACAWPQLPHHHRYVPTRQTCLDAVDGLCPTMDSLPGVRT